MQWQNKFTLQSFMHADAYCRSTFLQGNYIRKILESIGSKWGFTEQRLQTSLKLLNGNNFTCKWLLTWEMDSKFDFIISSIALGFASAIIINELIEFSYV